MYLKQIKTVLKFLVGFFTVVLLLLQITPIPLRVWMKPYVSQDTKYVCTVKAYPWDKPTVSLAEDEAVAFVQVLNNTKAYFRGFSESVYTDSIVNLFVADIETNARVSDVWIISFDEEGLLSVGDYKFQLTKKDENTFMTAWEELATP